MTRVEFIAAVQALPNFSKLVNGPNLENTNQIGDERYQINVRFINGNKAYYHNLYFVIINPGEAGEQAYYLFVEPTAELQASDLAAKQILG